MNLETAEMKSNFKQFVLVLLLGPFGLFYSNKLLAVIAVLLFFILLGAYFLGFLIVWLFSFVAGFYSVKEHNKRVNEFEKLKRRYKHLG
jgi:hypothetical protein